MILLALGQSNACNCGQGPHTGRGRVIDARDATAHPLSDPLSGDIGTQGSGGSVWSRLGDLIPDFTVIPAGIAGSFAHEWITLIDPVLASLRVMPTHIIWQQGESEANHTQRSAEDYAKTVRQVFAKIRSVTEAPIYVAQCSVCECGEHPFNNHAAIRNGQRYLVNLDDRIFPGPDFDTVTDRFDGCHFTAEGLWTCARMWRDVLTAERMERAA